jgi:hypothetical protein
MLVLLWFRDVGSGWTYGPELFNNVELDIVLGDLLEDNKVVLGLVEGREGGRVSAEKKMMLEGAVQNIGVFEWQYQGGYSQRIHGEVSKLMAK